MVLECTKKRLKHIERKLVQLNKEISKLPDGKLVCYRNGKGKGVKWYHVIGSRRDWIYKKNRDLACKLAYKQLLQARISDLDTEKKLIENLYSNETNCTTYSTQTEAVLNNPFLSDLLTGTFCPRNVATREWANADYNRNLLYPEQLIHPTLSGIKVRSKSEATIERVLSINKIAFRYECALELNGAIYYR